MRDEPLGSSHVRALHRARAAGWVVVFAQDEARGLKHNYIGTEHLLLGLLRVEDGVAARVLASLYVTVEEVRAQVARIIGPGDETPIGEMPFTPRTKKVLELSLREARAAGHQLIGTEDILVALMREGEGVAAQILHDFDVDAEKIRNEVETILGRSSAPASSAPRRAPRPSGHLRVSDGWQLMPILVGWLLFGVSLGIGVLIGWLIWG